MPRVRVQARHLRRKSSRIERWRASIDTTEASLQSGDVESAETKTSPYLAYPQFNDTSLYKEDGDDRCTLNSYILVDDVPRASLTQDAGLSSDKTPRPSPPSTPRKISPFHQTQGIFNSPSPLRNFHLSFGSRRSSTSSNVTRSQTPTPAPAVPRLSADKGSGHSRGSSISTLYALSRPDRTISPDLASYRPRSQSAWKFKRPGVMDHFTVPSDDNADVAPPRPSMSSSVTRSSATSCARSSLDTPTESASASRKLKFGSVRAQSPAAFSTSSPSLWSLPTDASHMYDPPDSTKVIARDREKHGAVRIPLSLKSPTVNGVGFGGVSSVLPSPRSRKKRKLVIGGIPAGDERRFEAVKKWCESFGEVSHIVRVPNGNLHVEFRKAEVAETVCRLQARVYINGVGSVCLSYYTGKKP